MSTKPGLRGSTADEGWHDQLVNLHVLTESGDVDASVTAEEWIASDPAARRVWQQVDADCAQLRADTRRAGDLAAGEPG